MKLGCGKPNAQCHKPSREPTKPGCHVYRPNTVYHMKVSCHGGTPQIIQNYTSLKLQLQIPCLNALYYAP